MTLWNSRIPFEAHDIKANTYFKRKVRIYICSLLLHIAFFLSAGSFEYLQTMQYCFT